MSESEEIFMMLQTCSGRYYDDECLTFEDLLED